MRIAPPGYVTTHIHRRMLTHGKINFGGGLAVIYRDNLSYKISCIFGDMLALKANMRRSRSGNFTRILLPKFVFCQHAHICQS